MLLEHPDASDVERHQSLRLAATHDQLGRTAADIDDHDRARLVEIGQGAEERGARFFLAGQYDRFGPGELADSGEELLSVASVAYRGSTRNSQPLDTQLATGSGVFRDRPERSVETLGRQHPGPIDALAQSRDHHPAI